MSHSSSRAMPAKSAGRGQGAGHRLGVLARPGGAATASTAHATDGPPILSPAEGRIAELRLAAADYVQRAIGCELDDSEESLAFADHYLGLVAQDGDRLRDEVLQLVATALGVYLGEVIRTRFGGRWVALPPEPRPPAKSAAAAPAEPPGDTPILDSMDDPAGWRLQLAAVPLLADPIGMAVQALRPPTDSTGDRQSDRESDQEGDRENSQADADGADAVGFATTPELTVPLRAALARLPPVTVDYYYSLTGRFETLSYAVELLAELQQKAAAANSPESAADAADASPESDEADDPTAAGDRADDPSPDRP